MTDDKTIEDDPDELAKKAMMEEWDSYMADFVPNDMLSVQLNPREEIVSFIINIHFINLLITLITFYSLCTRMHLKIQSTSGVPTSLMLPQALKSKTALSTSSSWTPTTQ